jgi:hypothetical protein
MDGILSVLAVAVGLLIIVWLCGPAGRGRPARHERDQAAGDDARALNPSARRRSR